MEIDIRKINIGEGRIRSKKRIRSSSEYWGTSKIGWP